MRHAVDMSRPVDRQKFQSLFDDPEPVQSTHVDLSGRLFGPYRIERQLADRPYCQVYLGRDRSLARPVALKVLKSIGTLTPNIRRRFESEGRILAQVRHPNVVQIFGMHVIDDLPCLAMEYIAGPTLADCLDDRPLNIADAVAVLERIARGVAAAQARGIVHRDLKPENVLFDEEVHEPSLQTRFGFVKVVDFGIARLLGDINPVTRTGDSQPRTIRFMSPEQARDLRDEIGSPTDVHALGILAYTMITGVNPFAASTVAETVDAVANRVPEPPSRLVPDIPSWLDELCLQCLAKAPGDRLPNADRFADELQQHARAIGATSIVSSAGSEAADGAHRPDGSAALLPVCVGIVVVVLATAAVVRWAFG